MRSKKHFNTCRGSALSIALIMVGVLIALGAASLVFINDKYRVVYQAASWQEALMTADAGIDVAVTEIRKDLVANLRSGVWTSGEWKNIADNQAPATADDGWSILRASYDTFKNTEESGTFDTPAGLYRVFNPTDESLSYEGEGANAGYIAKVSIDVPYIDDKGALWFRVRSKGICNIPGSGVAAGSREDIRLRKLKLQTGTTPQAIRSVEAIVRPVFAAELTLLAKEEIDMNNHNIFLASYDSTDPEKSTNGQYDEAKKQWNANIAAIGGVIDAGDATVFGRAATNGGDILNSDNIKGNFDGDPDRLRQDYDVTLLDVTAPNITGTPTDIDNDYTITASPTSGEPTYALVNNINLTGGATLRIAGAEDGSSTSVVMLVQGDIDVKGNGLILIDPGVHLRIFVKGDADFSGNGISNPAPNTPVNLQIYGVDRPADDPSPIGEIKLAGTTSFQGTVYAPNYDISIVGGGNDNSTISGAFVGRNIRMTGVQSVYYDEALAEEGLVIGYRVASWFEDER